MDKIDAEIIKELSINSKKTLKEISRSVNISKEAINTRISKLIEDGVILPYTIINYFNIGNKNIHVQIKFEKLDIEDINNIINKLIKKESIGWIAETFHKYDLSLSIIYKNYEVVEKIIQEIKKWSKNKIKKINFMNIRDGYYFSYTNKKNNIRKKVVKVSKTKNEKIMLRNKEKDLIKNISDNGRFKLTTMGQKLDLTSNSIKYLVKELEKKEIILDFGLYINYLKLGFKWYKVILETYIDDDVLKKLFPLKNIVFVCKTYEERIIIDYIGTDTIHVRNFVNEVEKIIGKINSYEIYELIKTHKIDNSNKQ